MYKGLTEKDIYSGNIVKFNNQKMLLISKEGDEISFVEEDYHNDLQINVKDDSPVYMKCRWLVEIQPETIFDKPFKTHRHLIYLVGDFDEFYKLEISKKNFFKHKDRESQLNSKPNVTEDDDNYDNTF